ncbi:MAG: 2-oxo-4-hydroxy-4-carboxy-5-ureidoimidazoline decarboxylase [Granulosicoccus sp.]
MNSTDKGPGANMPLSDLSRQMFVQYFGAVYEQSPWVVERAYSAGLTLKHDKPEILARHFQRIVEEATDAERLSLVRSYPDLFGKEAIVGTLSKEASIEQASVGLADCTPEQLERFNELNRLYWGRFGFPFVMALKGRTQEDILSAFGARMRNDVKAELSIAVGEIHNIARSRLNVLLKVSNKQASSESAWAYSAGLSQSAADNDHVKGPEGLTPAQMRDPDYFPGFFRGLPLGIQHVLAMFVSNVTPAIIVAGAVGFGFGSPDTSDMIYMIQMSMLFAGIATLIQTISLGPVGARLPIVQGTSFAFIPVMIPIAKVYGMAALMGGIVIGGIFHFFLGTIIGRLRHWLPPLVTGLVVLMIGLALVKVGIQYAAGGVPMMGKPEYGSLTQWSLALVVIAVTLLLKFFARGMLSVSAVLLGLISGYLVAFFLGMVNFDAINRAAWFALPDPLHFGFEINVAAVIGMCLMSFVSAIETVGDISGITKGGAGREATNREVAGGTMADGAGTALSGVFGALPNTSFSQNVGLISMTGLMSRHVVTLGALFLILCGLVPKVGAAIQTMPIAVLGGGVIVMFGMVAAAGVNMLADVDWNRRNMMIFGIALSLGLGLQLEPGALQHLPDTAKVLMTSGLLPAAMIAIILNVVLPHRSADDRPQASPEHR